MKHVMLSDAYKYGVNPFAAYRAELSFGRNQHDFQFLPVKDVAPVREYVVTADYGKIILYAGTDKAEADVAKARYDDEQKAKNGASSAQLNVGLPILPDGKFRIIKTAEKGTILVVPGNDNTDRCLLFVGCVGGFRGGTYVKTDGTTGNIIKECSASNACDSAVEIIVLLKAGQTIALRSYGRRNDDVYLYTWDGEAVEKKCFSFGEWEARNSVATPQMEDAEIL